MTKNWKKITAEKNLIFGIKNYPLASLKDVQVTEEAFSSQKRPSNTSKHELLNKFSTFVGHFCPPGSGSRFRIRIHWPDWIRIQSLSTASSYGRAGCIHFRSQQFERAVCISFHHQQYGRAGYIHYRSQQFGPAGGVFLSITSSMDVQGVFWEQIKLFCFLSDNERTISKRFAFVPIISGPNQNVLLWSMYKFLD